ncbi:MAG: GDP-mannose 4,6-dehydratase [Methanomicrobiales archaeon]|nr:GDP-mannose 4,6-dehydratase [Methanomicrobiales archaeon]
METKNALITGITGQDGSYLSEFLLEKGYNVFGLVRRLSTPNITNISHILDDVHLIEGDMLDQSSIDHALRTSIPAEVYNLAAQSFVATSWQQPVLTGEINALGTVRLLQGIRSLNNGIRFYQASSSEMFGKIEESPQNERTRFYPRSPYGISKVYAYWATVNYRESYRMFCANGILFNHESPRRGIEFVTRKITDAVARIHKGIARELRLGNLGAQRDWGFAGDYVRAMWLMLQQDRPDDFVIATGVAHSVRDFVDLAFREAGLDYRNHVVVDPAFFRPAEVQFLLGDASKANRQLGWHPLVAFPDLVRMMVQEDLRRYGTV